MKLVSERISPDDYEQAVDVALPAIIAGLVQPL